MTVDDYIDALAESDGNDREIQGLTDALRAAVALMGIAQRELLEEQLPKLLPAKNFQF